MQEWDRRQLEQEAEHLSPHSHSHYWWITRKWQNSWFLSYRCVICRSRTTASWSRRLSICPLTYTHMLFSLYRWVTLRWQNSWCLSYRHVICRNGTVASWSRKLSGYLLDWSTHAHKPMSCSSHWTRPRATVRGGCCLLVSLNSQWKFYIRKVYQTWPCCLIITLVMEKLFFCLLKGYRFQVTEFILLYLL